MPKYRRQFVAGGTYFFTLKTERNAPIFQCDANSRLLGTVFREMQQRWSFDVVATVLLPDHLHSIWSLPAGDSAYPVRWAWLKKEFSKRYLLAGGEEQHRSDSRIRNRRRGVWQRRYWEHTIVNEDEFDAYFDYLHWNPVKHGFVSRPRDWQHSTFHRWARAGVYEPSWGCGLQIPDRAAKVNLAGE